MAPHAWIALRHALAAREGSSPLALPTCGCRKVFRRGLVARDPAEIATTLGLDGGLIAGELNREAAEAVARAARDETGATHVLAVLIEIDDGPDRIDFGGSIHLAIAADEDVESRRSRIYGGCEWVRLGAVELGLDCLLPLPTRPPGHRTHRFRAERNLAGHSLHADRARESFYIDWARQ